jgi:dihydropyrimidinase
MEFDLVVSGGTLATAEAAFEGSVAVSDGRIAAIVDPRSTLRAREHIDASGCVVVPGGVDPHVHFWLPDGKVPAKHDFDNGSIAAAIGGTTTVISFAVQRDGAPPIEAVVATRNHATSLSCIDFGLHCILTDPNIATVDGLADVVSSGVTSFKVFMTRRRGTQTTDDGFLADVLREAARLRALTLVHAENGAILERRTAQLLAAGRTGPEAHPLSRPPFLEAEAVRRAAFLAQAAGAALYVVHVSSRLGQAEILEARVRGVPVYGETCPHYLTLTEDVYQRHDALDYTVTPPIRSQLDQDALWEGIRSGTLSTVGSDDCAWDTSQRRERGQSFDQVRNGSAGVETRLPIMFGLGVATGRVTLPRMVAVCSTNPAKLFGLYPQKGSLLPGADADLVVLDPNQEREIKSEDLHMGVDHLMLAGTKLRGYPAVTISAGRVIARGGEFVGERGRGRFLPRTLDQNILREAVLL